MFGIQKRQGSNVTAELQEFLEEADERYIKAFETRSIGVLTEYFTRDCCRMISRAILAEASFRYFSDAKFRETTWNIISETPTVIEVEKQCIYRNVKLSLTKSMKISDDYVEKWTVQVSPEEYWVSNVEAMQV